jgi:hypothetical protein
MMRMVTALSLGLANARAKGIALSAFYLTPDEYRSLAEDMQRTVTLIERVNDGLHLFGVPLIMVPFADDPLFKQLQAMAALAGVAVTYLGGEPLTMAEYFTGGGGWRFDAGPPSRLFPIQASLQEIAA